MGTDLHLEVERQIEGKWHRIPHGEQPCTSCADFDRETGDYGPPRGWFHPWVTPDEILETDTVIEESENRGDRVQVDRKEPCYSCNGTLVVHYQYLYSRNYDVFAILGNVRNGSGFAGTRTSSGFEPISDQRGLPYDLSQEIRDHLDRIGYRVEGNELVYLGGDEDDDLYDVIEKETDGWWSLGEHSLSWILLSEIDEYEWNRSVTKEGWVDPWQFEIFRREGQPHGWSGGISGMGVEHISDTQMAEMIDSGEIIFEGDEKDVSPFQGRRYTTSLQRAMGDWDLPEGSTGAAIRDRSSHYCLIKWEESYRNCVGEHFFKELEEIRALAPDGDASRLRLVFGYDS